MEKFSRVVRCIDLKKDLAAFLEKTSYDRLFVLTDTNTLEHCFPLIKDVSQIKDATVITVKAGDLNKNINQLSEIWELLSNGGASRGSLMINLGGGMITDMGGFAAATFKRGMKSVNIPTTLMAAVDAAVGGKTGINFNGLKNEVGSFYPPLCVFIETEFFKTIDHQNLLSGYSEMIKHALLSDQQTLALTLSFDLNTPDLALLKELVVTSVEVKERIVEEDPFEKGIRKALNLGHTIGHAFESLSFKKDKPLLHGHAVAAGLICELYLSYKLCGFPGDVLSKVVSFVKEFYSPFVFDCTDFDALYAYMLHDKKNEGGVINFTLLKDVGEVMIDQNVDRKLIDESLDFYRDSFGF